MHLSNYNQASIKTADNLRTVAHSSNIRSLSSLSLPEIDAVVDAIARVVPAGNVPGVILNGLARLSARRIPLQTVRRDINLLFKGVEQIIDKAVYSTFFAGPAAVIWGYQKLLKLVGKKPEDAFPEGIWQFYVDYALREDTARHTNETHGFDSTLRQHQIQLSTVNRIAAWTMASIHCLHQYTAWLENEWRERVYTKLLVDLTRDTPHATRYADLYKTWCKQRPYSRKSDVAARETYPAYRRRKFDAFLAQEMADLPPALRRTWQKQIDDKTTQDLAAYQRQLSILAYLHPGPYGETRVPLPLDRVHIGIIYQGRYYLVPVCAPQTTQPLDAHTVRQYMETIIAHPSDAPVVELAPLAQIKRTEWGRLHEKLDPSLLKELDLLRLAPILINCDLRPRHFPLAELRQAERGIGHHALTLFFTGETVVFDQSHIFFDGAWGAALSEIMTNEALSWATFLHRQPAAQPGPQRPYTLCCSPTQADREQIHKAARVPVEASAETQVAHLKAILTLRKLFKQRSDLLHLTVNDLLVLYRAIHAARYRPSPDLVAALEQLTQVPETQQAAQVALQAMRHTNDINPAILIPVDASWQSPRDRLYPMTFEVPLADLDLLNLHDQVIAALDAYQNETGDRDARYAQFDRLQRTYLAALAGFGEVSNRAKTIALQGQSDSLGTIKLLAHLPAPLQHMLDAIPGQFDALNDVIKGREVFSNVGAVAPASTLTRFITAKDDNEQKALAWGVITDSKGTMRISLRDFRPHVGMLNRCGHPDLAVRITQDYVEAYARGLEQYIDHLLRITQTSRDTHRKGTQ